MMSALRTNPHPPGCSKNFMQLGIVVCAWNSSTQKAESAGRVKASLSYMYICSETMSQKPKQATTNDNDKIPEFNLKQ